MLVKFHVLQLDDETGKTHHEPLFSQEWGLIRTGQQLSYMGIKYQVHEMEWLDMKEGVLKAVCLEVHAG